MSKNRGDCRKVIPCHPRSLIRLPVRKLEGTRLLKYLRSHSPTVSMDYWAVIKADQSLKYCIKFMSQLNGECLTSLEGVYNKLRFAARKSKLIIFKRANPGDDLNVADDAKNLLKKTGLVENFQ